MSHRDEFENSAKIRVLHAINRVFSRVYHRVEVEGDVRVPRTGPVLIVSNHISSLDPLLIQSVVNRPIVWMVAKEYFDVAPLGWLFKSIQSIPVSRNGRDSTALRAAMRALSAGRVLGVFPEGRIARSRQMLPLQTGAAMLAMRSVATVVPVYQFGTSFGQTMANALVVPQRVRLRFAGPIPIDDLCGESRTAESATEEIERILSNLEQAPYVGNE